MLASINISEKSLQQPRFWPRSRLTCPASLFEPTGTTSYSSNNLGFNPNQHCQKSMDDTFLLSNIVPQDLDNNSDFWNRLEIYCRDLTKKVQLSYPDKKIKKVTFVVDSSTM